MLVPEGAPIRMGPNASAHVYTFRDGDWVLSANRVTVPEGWFVVPPSFVDTEGIATNGNTKPSDH